MVRRKVIKNLGDLIIVIKELNKENLIHLLDRVLSSQSYEERVYGLYRIKAALTLTNMDISDELVKCFIGEVELSRLESRLDRLQEMLSA